jgi:hypothetical protein
MTSSRLSAIQTASDTARSEGFSNRLPLRHDDLREHYPSSEWFSRFDPFEGVATDPQSLHKYTYAHSDPVNHVDPSGLFTLGQAISVGAIAGGLAGLTIGAVQGAREAGEFFSFKTLEYAFYGLVAGAVSGALVGGATFLAAPAVARLLPSGIRLALSGNHPSFAISFGVGVVAGLGASAADTSQAAAAASTITSGGLSAGALYFTTRGGKELIGNVLGGGFLEWFRKRVLFTNWAGRAVTPQGIPRAFGSWGLMFTAGFAVGYTTGELTQGLTNVFIRIAENGLDAKVAADNQLTEGQAEALLDA